MANVAKVSIALTEDLASLVRDAVQSGEYASTSEVIRDALRGWKVKRDLERAQIEELRRLWDEGISSGSAGPFDLDAIKREAHQKYAGKLGPTS